jgi:hypothetical protein
MENRLHLKRKPQDFEKSCAPNGSRYRRLGGLRERQFSGINLKPRKMLENAQSPRRRVHALLGAFA